MGLDDRRALSAVRLSLGRWSTTDDVDVAIAGLVQGVDSQATQ